MTRRSYDCEASPSCEREDSNPADLNIDYGKGKITGFIANDWFSLEGPGNKSAVDLEFLEATKLNEYKSEEFDGVLGLGFFTPGKTLYKEYQVEICNDTIVDALAASGHLNSSIISFNLHRKTHSSRPHELLLGGWETKLASSEELIHWFPFSDQFAVDLEYVSIGMVELMINYKRSCF